MVLKTTISMWKRINDKWILWKTNSLKFTNKSLKDERGAVPDRDKVITVEKDLVKKWKRK